MSEPREPDGIVLTDAQKRSRRRRSIATAVALGLFVVVVFVTALVKGVPILRRPL
jgi:hypothetical protein